MKLNISIFLTLALSFTNYAVKAEESLYQQLGGQSTIESITTNLIERITTNPKIEFLFKETDHADLQVKIVNQICMETGGPCKYEGLDMVEAHSGMDIKYAEFDIFVQDFILAMDDAAVPFRLQNKVLAIFAPMREDTTYE
jgi:hemoglobin